MKTFIPLGVIAALTVLISGCASSGYQKADNTSTSLQKAAQDIDHALVPLDNVLVTLSDLVNSPQSDITDQFKKYRSAVDKLESLANDITDHATAMQEDGADYFKKWDEELAKIQNENIHTRSLDRKNAVVGQLEKVRVSYEQTKRVFAPFMSDLKDIRMVMETDLTSGGLDSIKGLSDKANTKAIPLRASLVQLAADFRSLGISLSPAVY
jgi:outer membrane murein-binding lipoprotein Lpp